MKNDTDSYSMADFNITLSSSLLRILLLNSNCIWLLISRDIMPICGYVGYLALSIKLVS